MALYLFIALSACIGKEDNTSSLRIEIIPSTVRHDKLEDTIVKITVTNISDKNIVYDRFLPSFAYCDGEHRIPGIKMPMSLEAQRISSIEPQETVELLSGDVGITFGRLIEDFSSPEILEKTAGTPRRARIYSVEFKDRSSDLKANAEFTVTPPLSQVILRYALIFVPTVVVLGFLLFFFRRIVRRKKRS